MRATSFVIRYACYSLGQSSSDVYWIKWPIINLIPILRHGPLAREKSFSLKPCKLLLLLRYFSLTIHCLLLRRNCRLLAFETPQSMVYIVVVYLLRGLAVSHVGLVSEPFSEHSLVSVQGVTRDSDVFVAFLGVRCCLFGRELLVVVLLQLMRYCEVRL